jgi:hypothetical protein
MFDNLVQRSCHTLVQEDTLKKIAICVLFADY